MKKHLPDRRHLFSTFFYIAVIVVAAWLLSVFHYRLDLTSDKRYTLSDYTKATLRDLDHDIHVQVYLDGDLNIPFRKMQQRLKETLEEFQVLAGKHITYQFINPFAGKNQQAADELANEMMEKGLRPTNIISRDKEGGSQEKLVFPGAIVQCGENEAAVNLLKNNPSAGAEENLNNSIQAFEFEFMRVISALTADSTGKIVFIEGHGEYNEYQVGDITNELGWNYQVDRGPILGRPGVLDNYKAVVIAGPVKPFSEQDKFVLDQYLMQGGRILWFIDMVDANLDSISSGNPMLTMIRSLNIEDLLFRCGVRINPVLIQDVQCNMIPVNVALAGNAPDFRPAPWLYSPLLTPPGNNPVTRNLNLIKSEFAGYIDTIEARKGIKKTVLLSTSQFTRQVAVPTLVSLDEIRITPQQNHFTSRFLPVSVLLEGKFETAFRNRMMTELFPDTLVKVAETGQQAAVMVTADADIIRNDYRPTPNGVLITPLGYDRLSEQTYGNKEFIVNAIQYMTGRAGLINLRSRTVTLRLLNKAEISENRVKWVLINTVLPPVVIILAGLCYFWFRKRKYIRA